MASTSTSYKTQAAALLVDKFVTSGSTLGLGSGELVSMAVSLIGDRLAKGALHSVVAVPSCAAAASEAAFSGVPLTTLEKAGGKVDLTFEEVDQLDLAQNAAVKGVKSEPQQPQLLAARTLVAAAARCVLLVDASNLTSRLSGTLPVVIDAENWEEPAEELDDIFIGDAELWRRPMSGTANPRGGDNPYVSPEGHNIIDIKFEKTLRLFGEEEPYAKIKEEIENVQGVVTSGLLLNAATAVIVARNGAEPELSEL